MAPPRQKRPHGRSSNAKSSKHTIDDPRFKNIETDPRFRLPSGKHNRVELDKRFSRMLDDEDFYQKASVDRYGRKLPKTAGKKALEKFYRLDDEDAAEDDDDLVVDDDDEVQNELARVNKKYDPARDGGFSDSSSSSSDDEDDDHPFDDLDDDALVEIEGDEEAQDSREEIPVGETSARLAVVNLDWDHIRAVDLMAVASSFCPPEGKVLKVSVYPSEFGKERIEREETEGPPKELFGAMKPADVKVDRTAKPTSQNFDSDSDKELDDEEIKEKLISQGDSTDFDPHALRSYQLSRLKYYYAVITTTSAETALALYTSMDGREYLSTANYFDLRFIPDDLTFPDSDDPTVPKADKARDECTKVPDGYQANDFVTDALTHSKVRLTWDEEDQARKEVQKRAFSRTEIDENDLKAYIGTDDSESEAEKAEDGTTKQSGKVSQAELSRQKMRAALGLSAEPTTASTSKKNSKPQSGDMQITFTTALSASDKKDTPVFSNEPEETTREKYIRLERERKARRKAKAKAAREGEDEDVDTEPAPTNNDEVDAANGADESDPFADPFFEDPSGTNKALQKAAKRAKREKAEADAAAETQRKEKERRELELLMMDDETDALTKVAQAADDTDPAASKGQKARHFDMRDIKRAEKLAAKSKQSRKAAKRLEREAAAKAAASGNPDGRTTTVVDDFNVAVADPRFAALYSNHEYAIDPTNPRFSGTKGMKSLLEEGRRRRKAESGREDEGVEREGKASGAKKAHGKRVRIEGEGHNMSDIDALVKRVKSRQGTREG